MSDEIYLLAAIAGILGALYAARKSILKYYKKLINCIIAKKKNINENWSYKKRVKLKKITNSDYHKITKKIESETATNLERDAYYTYQKEHPMTKLKLPDGFLENMKKDFLAKEMQKLQINHFDPSKYIKK